MTKRAQELGFMLLFFLICFGILAVVFPVWDRLKYFDYPAHVTFGHYGFVALSMTVLGLVVAPALLWKISRENLMLRMFLRAFVVFVITAICSVAIGTAPGEVADALPIHGPFFAEWKFVRFTLYFGSVVALMSAVAEYVMSWPAKK